MVNLCKILKCIVQILILFAITCVTIHQHSDFCGKVINRIIGDPEIQRSNGKACSVDGTCSINTLFESDYPSNSRVDSGRMYRDRLMYSDYTQNQIIPQEIDELESLPDANIKTESMAKSDETEDMLLVKEWLATNLKNKITEQFDKQDKQRYYPGDYYPNTHATNNAENDFKITDSLKRRLEGKPNIQSKPKAMVQQNADTSGLQVVKVNSFSELDKLRIPPNGDFIEKQTSRTSPESLNYEENALLTKVLEELYIRDNQQSDKPVPIELHAHLEESGQNSEQDSKQFEDQLSLIMNKLSALESYSENIKREIRVPKDTSHKNMDGGNSDVVQKDLKLLSRPKTAQIEAAQKDPESFSKPKTEEPDNVFKAFMDAFH